MAQHHVDSLLERLECALHDHSYDMRAQLRASREYVQLDESEKVGLEKLDISATAEFLGAAAQRRMNAQRGINWNGPAAEFLSSADERRLNARRAINQ